MQSVDVGKLRSAGRLHQLLDELQAAPDTDLKTLRKVRAGVSKLAGQRMTINPGHALAARLAQAKILSAGTSTPIEAARKIMAGLGTSESSARRYVKMLRVP